MFSLTRLVDVDEPHRHRLLGQLQDAAAGLGARRVVVAPTHPGSRNGGDVLMHLRFDREADADSAAMYLAPLFADNAVSGVKGADYRGTPLRCAEPAGTVYRTLLLRVHPDTPARVVAQFERELAILPQYVSTIRAWQLSRVDRATGATGWTHVFEQEFSDVDGLMGPYLMHPMHWAVVDRWFDPETTDVIITDRVCHSFCAIDAAVLT